MESNKKTNNANNGQDMLEIARRLASLPHEKRAVFRQRLLERGIDFSRLPIVPLAERPAQLPLSFAQQRLWFLHQLEPDSAAYNIPGALRLIGELDADALKSAFEALVRRHESLRTMFRETDGKAEQVVVSNVGLMLPVIDLSGLTDASRQVEAQRLAQAEAAKPFDLGAAPLLRTSLLKLSSTEHILLATMHHIISDGWSMNVLMQELGTHYEAAMQGSAAKLPPLPIQYADFAVWQQEWLTEDALATQLGYWKKQLGSEHPVLELPTDRPRPALQSGRGARFRFTLEEELAEGLRRLSREQGATLFMLLLAAFDVLLHRLSGQSEIRVGVPIANRNRMETEGLIGFFVNTQVLRAELDGRFTFVDLLDRVKHAALGAQTHQDLPLEQLVDALQPQRNLSHSPLFQVMFNLQNSRLEASRSLVGLRLQSLPQDSGTTQFDLSLDVMERETGLDVVLTYSTDLFDAATVERFAGYYTNLLRAVVAEPQSRIAELPLLGDAEYRRVTRDWSTVAPACGEFVPVHQLFEARAEAMPQALALIFDDMELSYAELNAQANRLAHRLIGLGIGADTRVGVCVERSVEMIVGLLAILKAGGAYVPLDPGYPQERLAYMIGDAGVQLLLTQPWLTERLQLDLAGLTMLDVTAPSRESPSHNPGFAVHPHQLAYVMYTSGSTGRPKGVGIPHGALAAHAQVARDFFGLQPGERMLQFATFNFDGFVEQLYPALTCGASVVLRGPDLWDSEELVARIVRHRIAVLDLTTAYWFQVVQDWAAQGRRDYGVLRQVNVGGEAMPPEGLAAWRAAGLEDVRLLNTYGPTEATVTAMLHDCADYVSGKQPKPLQMPIGQALPGRAIYLLDRDGNPAPIGSAGELCIGGALLARGYHGRPDLSAERFIPDPFGAPGARLYRTGDLARWRIDGVIEYLGRIDHQVKIRGFRIELPEIEACLLAHPAIREAIVLAREDRPGDKRLVAYLVAHGAMDNDANDTLRTHLKAALPDYMVPSAFVYLDAMPMSPNGKLDRQALPAPELEPDQARYVAPGNPTEAALAKIWADVLGLEQVGIHDNFFELGGDSILVLQIVSRGRRAGLSISPKDLFQHQTIGSLALAARQESVAADTGPVAGDVPLSPIQCWFFEQSFAEPQHWNQSLLLEARQPIDAEHLEQALTALLQHHDALRLRFTRTGNDLWRQAYADEARRVTVQTIDLSTVAAAELPERLHAACNRVQASLNLEQGPLLAAAHVRLPERGERLLLVIHHLAVDGVSWRILLEDLQAAYTQLAAGQAVALPAKSHSYRAWAERLQTYAQSAECRQELDYWQSAVKPMALPVRDPQGENLVRTAERIDVRLDAEETRQLLQQAPAAYRTQINDLLLSALAQAVCRWSGTEHALIELEGHGREDVFDGIDISRTVGWFTSRFPVSLTPANDPAATIKAVKEQLRRVPNNGFGWGVLEYLAGGDTRAAIKTLPQPHISFNYFGQFGRAMDEAAAFAFARETDGDTANPSGRRTHWLEVNGHIANDSLAFGWTFSPSLHDRHDVEQLAQDYLRELRALIAHCLHTEGGATPSDFPLADLAQAEIDRLPLNAIEDIYPLAPMQQGMLFHSLYTPEADVYVNQFHCVLRGGIAFDAFRAAWEQALARHAILRTSFQWQREGEALQLVWRQAALPFQQLDWSGLSVSEHAARLDDFIVNDQARGFTVEQAPLMRLTLIRRFDGAAEFIWTSHHLLLDGWSTAQLLDEVLSGYFAQLDGKTLDLPRPRRYRDYVEWVRRQPLDAAERYWRDNLAGLSAPLRLSELIARPAQGATGYGDRTLTLSIEETGALQQLAQRQRVTFNTLLQGAWALLLWRYSGRRDIVFGVTVAGRPTELAGVDTMLGLFINTLPMVCRLDPTQDVGVWLRQLQTYNVEARQFETTPLADIQRWSVAGGGNALFDSLLVFENYPVDATLRQAGARLAVDVTRKADLTNYPLTLTVAPGAQLRLSLTYDRAHVGEAAVERLQAHLRRLLLGFVEREGARLHDIPLLPAAEFRQLTVDWSATARDYPIEQPVHVLFEAQAAATPDAVALLCRERQFTYGELNAQANRLAHRLIQEGVKHDSLVGLCTERSAEMVVALLAILKAGGAYVPLDPDYPQERLAYMIEDAGLALLLTQRRVCERLALDRPGLPLLELDALDTSLADLPAMNPGLATSGEHLAYAIYTSGSTGKPKGVMVRHTALSNFLFSMREAPGLQAHDVLAAVTSLSFDIAALEIYLPLICGAQLVLVERELAVDGPRLASTMMTVGATALQATPATWRLLVESGWQGQPHGLKGLCGGEALAPDLAAALLARQVSLWNMYGPTETTIWSALARIEDGIEGGANSPPLGRPIANTGIYLLDTELDPVPVGTPGELYIGGAGLARGYHGRPDLTAERFIPAQFGTPGARLYRTGDLARWRQDGVIEYLGRIDHQVKIRGFRIELGEIEARLLQHEAIREAAVVAREDRAGDKRLAAYLVMRHDEVSADELRIHLKQALPDYMVPSAFVYLNAMPLTPNGKLDRKALPAPDMPRDAGSGSSYAAPRNAVEAALARIWTEVLGVSQAGIHDNFFALGGHSLLATRLVSRVRSAFCCELPIRALFEAPTIAQLAGLLPQYATADTAPILPIPRNGSLPLSFAQQRLWFLHQLEPDSAAYNIAAAVQLVGKLDAAALKAAFEALVLRHEALRTTFCNVDGEAVQVIAPQAGLALPLVDLTGFADAKSEAKRLAEAEAAAPFDLAAGPLLRLVLLKLASAEHILLVTMHHIVSDGWSMSVLTREFAACYEALVQGGQGSAVSLPPLPIQYADFAAWQRQWLTGAELDRQLAYWKTQLGSEHPLLELPADRPRPPAQSGHGATYRWTLAPELAEPLRQLCRRHGTTLFMTLLAVFDVLLHRLSGQCDLRVGVPIANRNRLETEGLIGFFVNTQVLRVELDGRLGFLTLLDRVKDAALGAQAHQDLPFEQLVEALHPQRNLSHSPLFQVMFNLVKAGSRAFPELPELTLESFMRDDSTTQFDLMFDVSERETSLDGLFTYSTDLFDAATIERIAGYYCNLLQAVIAQPQARIGDLPMLPVVEERQATVGWNATAVAYPQAKPVHALIELQAEATPDAAALVFEEKQLSYRELNEAANRLAHRLIAAGVAPDTLVGICAERSIELVVGLLAVLKAGGAYVPLDPDYPRERLAYMLDDAGIGLLLTQEALWSRLGLAHDDSSGRVGTVFCAHAVASDASNAWAQKTVPTLQVIDLDMAQAQAFPVANPGVAVDPHHLAYTIYTSGSTGKPKGAGVPHGGLTNRLLWMQDTYRLTGADRVLQKTPFGFDVSVWEFFWPLMTGAVLVVARPGDHKDPARLAELIQRQRITTLHFVPSMLQAFVDHGALPSCTSLRQVMASGEALPAELQQRFLRQSPATLHNLYGPTEASIDVTAWACSGQDTHTVPIGRPIANTQIYLLDADLNPVPMGVAGELYIGGVQLARGYHRRPELTAERFMPDPFNALGIAGARLYRTGDLARWRSDGAIEYLGRTDHQVKIRGLRIELGEIEARLLTHPAVREAVVVAREERAGDKRLVAYLVANEPVTAEALRPHLQAALPEYMVPAAFVLLDAMPLSPNGKLDRKALPAPEYAADAAQYAAPRNDIEAQLARIWSEVLGISQVGQIGIHDNFFELGGHSLLATRLVSRIRNELHSELPIRALFEAPSIAQLAERLHNHAVATETLPITPAGRDGKLALSFAQQRLWFLHQLQPDSTAYNIPSALRLSGELDVAALKAAFQALIHRHEALRTTFHDEDGEALQRIEPQASVTLPVIDLTGLMDQTRALEARRIAAEEAEQPFDLSSGPLLRLTLLKLGEQEHLLLVTMHHIVSDGWSMGVLVREFAALYRAFKEGRENPLPPLPIQYADFAVWQRQWLSGAELDKQLAFWKRQLGRDHFVLELPADRPRPAVLSGHGGKHRFMIEPHVVALLNALSRQHGTSLFMTLLAALDVWLHAHTGRNDPIVGTDIANRNRAETEDLVGFFINQLALRADLSGNPAFTELLGRTRQQVLDAYAHQDLPFDMLVETINPVRSLAHAPLFQVKLVLQNQGDQDDSRLSLPGLEVSPEPAAHGQVQLDLLLVVTETAAGLDCILEFSADLFDQETAAAFAREYAALLSRCVAEPSATLDALARSVSGMAREARLAKQQTFSTQGIGKLHTTRRKSIVSLNSQKDRQS